MRRLKLEHRCCEDLDKLNELYREKIDFKETNQIIENQKENTYQYLKSII